MDIRTELENKWGRFAINGHCYTQCNLDFISKDAQLNLLFSPVGTEEQGERTKFSFPNELIRFYSQTNGCRLFSDSLNIYGLHLYDDEIYEPFDINNENRKILHDCYNELSDYVFFGSLGGQYIFGYRKEDVAFKVYCFDVSDWKCIKVFSSFEIFFTSLFIRLYNEYDYNGRKIHPMKIHEDIKILYNRTCEKTFLEELACQL